MDLPFEIDEKIIGKWKTIAYVDNIEDFPGKINPDQILWLEYVDFKRNGQVIRKYFKGKKWFDRWTKGKLLDHEKSVVSKYFFKQVKGKEYMFLEWKMGNYIYGGALPTYYVFVKNT